MSSTRSGPGCGGTSRSTSGPVIAPGRTSRRMEATEAILALWRAFPDLAPAPGGAGARLMGFVSRAWRPIPLTHEPVDAEIVCARVLDGPAWAGSVPSGTAANPHEVRATAPFGYAAEG